jgi:polyferredoxin
MSKTPVENVPSGTGTPVTVRRKGEKRVILLQPKVQLNKPMHRYANWRHIGQAFFLGAFIFFPFLNIMRYDLETGKFVLFGFSLSILVSIPALILPIVLAGGVYLLLARNYGRVFCSSACMQGTMVELSNKIYMQLLGRTRLFAPAKTRQSSHFRTRQNRFKVRSPFKRLWLKIEAVLILFGLPFLVANSALAWFVNPATIWREYTTLSFIPVHLGAIVTMTALGVLNFIFVKDGFCRYLCYVNIVQQFAGQSGDLKGASPTPNFAQDCIHCNACVDVCYMNEDPRRRRPFQFLSKVDACVACGECVVACEAEMGRTGQAPVLQMPVLGNRTIAPVDFRRLRQELNEQSARHAK